MSRHTLPGPGGLDEIQFLLEGTHARVTPFGGHVLGWAPAGQEPVLYLSPRAVLDGSKPIRGGIPVCFPWFGAGPSGDREPAHGAVRDAPWRVEEEREDGLRLTTDAAEGFRLTLDATFGDDLGLRVTVTRTAGDAAPFELALHTYLSVGEAAGASVTGLAGARRFDQLTGEVAEQGDDPIRFDGEYDRVFTGCPGPQTLHDPVWNRRVVVTPTNLPSAVVWNPGPAKAASMGDLGEDQFPRFVCIESARVREDAVTLEPSQDFEAEVRFAVERI